MNSWIVWTTYWNSTRKCQDSSRNPRQCLRFFLRPYMRFTIFSCTEIGVPWHLVTMDEGFKGSYSRCFTASVMLESIPCDISSEIVLWLVLSNTCRRLRYWSYSPTIIVVLVATAHMHICSSNKYYCICTTANTSENSRSTWNPSL